MDTKMVVQHFILEVQNLSTKATTFTPVFRLLLAMLQERSIISVSTVVYENIFLVILTKLNFFPHRQPTIIKLFTNKVRSECSSCRREVVYRIHWIQRNSANLKKSYRSSCRETTTYIYHLVSGLGIPLLLNVLENLSSNVRKNVIFSPRHIPECYYSDLMFAVELCTYVVRGYGSTYQTVISIKHFVYSNTLLPNV